MFKIERKNGQVRGICYNMPGGVEAVGAWKEDKGQTTETLAVDFLSELEKPLCKVAVNDSVLSSMCIQYAVYQVCNTLTAGLPEDETKKVVECLIEKTATMFSRQAVMQNKYSEKLLAPLPKFRETTKQGFEYYTYAGMDVVPCCNSCNAWVILLDGTDTILVDKSDMPAMWGSNKENMMRLAWWLSFLDVPNNISVEDGNPIGRTKEVKARFLAIVHGVQQDDFDAVYWNSIGWDQPRPGIGETAANPKRSFIDMVRKMRNGENN